MRIKLSKFDLVLLALLLVLIVFFTFPLIFKFNSCIAGFSSTDESYGALWNFWWLKHAFKNLLPETTVSVIAVPFGIDSAQSGYPIWNFINRWSSVLANNIITYNLENLFSFFASALFMYFLVFYISGNKVCGGFSALIYILCPYHFARAWQHLGLAQIQWMPLYLLALFQLKDTARRKDLIFCVFALFMVFSFDLYYAFFMLIVTALFILFLFTYKIRIKLRERALLRNDIKTSGMIVFSCVLVFFLILPVVFQIFKNKRNYNDLQASAHNPYIRPFDDLFSQSARPLSYFLPSVVHPFFGKFTETFIGTQWYGESLTEHALYLGWMPLILAAVAFRRWRKTHRKKKCLDALPFGESPCDKEDFYVGFFVFLAVMAWLFSQPPWWNIFGFKLYMPAFFMYKILPMFRAYCRFGIVVMLAVAVLAGFGLKFTLERFKSQKTKLAVAAFFCGLVLFEFWNWPPYKVIDLSKVPAAYYWIKEQPKDIVIADYPLDADSPN